MEWLEILQKIFIAIISASAGFAVSGGVFTTLIVIGLMPRFAGKTHTAGHIFFYEEMVVIGAIFGTIFSVFYPFFQFYKWIGNSPVWETVYIILGQLFLCLYGFFAGIFVGCLALAIAEMLNSIPIFARRTKFRHGIGVVILFMALGKSVGSFIYFLKQLFVCGGM